MLLSSLLKKGATGGSSSSAERELPKDTAGQAGSGPESLRIHFFNGLPDPLDWGLVLPS